MTADRDVIILIQKLLDNRGRTPEEAAQFVAKAQDLMLAHDLSMEAVEVKGADHSTSVRETAKQGLHERGKPDGWKGNLFEAVARTSDCHPLYTWETVIKKWGSWFSGDEHDHTPNTLDGDTCDCGARRYGLKYAVVRNARLVGRHTDVEMAGYIYSYLLHEIERLTAEYAKSQWQAIWDYADRHGMTHQAAESEWDMILDSHPLRSKLSFVRGAATAVIESLKNDKAQRDNAAASHSALVIHKTADIEDYFDRQRAERAGVTVEVYREDKIKTAEKYREQALVRAKEAAAEQAKETPTQRKKREAKEERESDRYWRSESRRQAREEAKIDWRAQDAGYAAGRKVTVRPGITPGGPGGPAIGGE